MKNLSNYIANPVKHSSLQSLEKEEERENRLINKLFLRNLHRLIKGNHLKNVKEIHCVKGIINFK